MTGGPHRLQCELYKSQNVQFSHTKRFNDLSTAAAVTQLLIVLPTASVLPITAKHTPTACHQAEQTLAYHHHTAMTPNPASLLTPLVLACAAGFQAQGSTPWV
jgi:hypothetical protein